MQGIALTEVGVCFPLKRLVDSQAHGRVHLEVGHRIGVGPEHAARLAEALRFEPCSPTCANWLRYGIQPKNPRQNQRPGCCKGKAHRREYLGYAGRRVLTSRKWSGKTLDDHRADRRNWLTEMLGLPVTDPGRYAWELVSPGDSDHMPAPQRLLHVVADRLRWLQALDQARRRAQGQPPGDLPATEEAA